MIDHHVNATLARQTIFSPGSGELLSVKPNFMKFNGHYYEARDHDNCHYTSRHYKLKPGILQQYLKRPSPKFARPSPIAERTPPRVPIE